MSYFIYIYKLYDYNYNFISEIKVIVGKYFPLVQFLTAIFQCECCFPPSKWQCFTLTVICLPLLFTFDCDNSLWSTIFLNELFQSNIFANFLQLLHCEQYHIDQRLWFSNHINFMNTIGIMSKNTMSVIIICYNYLSRCFSKKS